MLNHTFWNSCFEAQYIPQIRRLVEVFELRLLPAFEHIEAEANEKERAELERLCSAPVNSDELDEHALARLARDTAAAQCEMVTDLRQGLINMIAAALHHLFEQQKMEFHRREVLRLNEERDINLVKDTIFQERLSAYGVDVTKFPCWKTLEELRHVANAVKHAEGKSAKELLSLRPELFRAPQTREFLTWKRTQIPRVFKPLVGDLHVSVEDIRRYRDAVEEFWRELSVAISVK